MDYFANTVYKKAKIIDNAYPLLLPPSRRKINCMIFHFAIWLDNNDVNYAVVIPATERPIYERSVSPHYILFNDKKDRINFTKWLNRYKKWFQNEEIENSFLPELPISGSHTLHILKHNISAYDLASGVASESFSDDFIKLWIWVIQNCKKPVYVLSTNSFAFSDAKDAVHFKLYWADILNQKEA